MTIARGGSITPVLQWAEPEGGVDDDFDMFVVDAGTKQVLASSTTVQAMSQAAVEYVTWTNTGATRAPSTSWSTGCRAARERHGSSCSSCQRAG